MRTAFLAMGICFVVFLGGCHASTGITGFRAPAFQEVSYDSVVVMARSGDLGRDNYMETQFVQCLARRKIDARPSTELFPPTRKFEEEEILATLNKERIGALLLVGLKQRWTTWGFYQGSSYSQGHEISAFDLIDAKTGSSAWVGNAESATTLLSTNMIPSLAAMTATALVKQGILRPAEPTEK